jgi:lipopolysaccharide export LptBFGC system permease protein LptF
MVRVLLFIVVIIGIIIFPLFNIDYKNIEEKVIAKQMPEVEFEKGEFYLYNKQLEKIGMFDKLSFDKKKYIAINLKIKNIIQKEEYKARKTVFKGELIRGYDVIYKNKDFELITNFAQYDKTTKILNGGQFTLLAKNFKGYGESFQVDEKKDLFAQNIKYFLKVEK